MVLNEYRGVPESDKSNEQVENPKWKFFLRQLLIASGIWTPYFAVGLAAGVPTVFIAQVRREANSTTAVSVEMASWLSSAFSYSALPCCLVMAYLTNYIGRKRSFIIVALNQLLVATCFFLSVTPAHLLITQVLQGVTNAGSITVCVVAIVEYTSPQNRGPMLTIKTVTVFWGIWAANAIGTYTPWKYVSVLGFLNAFYSLTVFFWPESPSWLATQGRFEECRRSHRWLRGCSKNSEQELEILIRTQIEERKIARSGGNMFKFFLDREFYYPITLCCITSLVYQLSGKQVITLYAIDVFKMMTSSESTAYQTMLILDGVTIFAMYGGCFLSRILKRRFMLFFFGSISMVLLSSIALYMYLVHLCYLTQNDYITISLLVAFSIAISLGPIMLGTSIHGELIPLKYKREATIVISCVFISMQAIHYKNMLYIMKYLEMHSIFLCYALSASIFLVVLYKYLPETKDKTLQEIEMYFKS